MSSLLFVLVLFPIIAGVLIYLLPKRVMGWVGIISQTIHLGLSIYSFLCCRLDNMTASLGRWEAPIGIVLFSDQIAASLILLASFLFLCFMIYNIHRHYVDRMFFMLFMSMQGLMAGIFLLDDLFSIFVLVEVSTMVVALLIMYKQDSRSMYDGLIYLLVNIFSMTFYMFGLAILYKYLGTFSMSHIREILPTIENIRPLYLPFSMMMTSVCLKAALMPLFSWLPKAHGTPSAPSVVSAALSGLYVKGGVYLYIRLSSVFGVIDISTFFMICGAITAIVGFMLAIAQTDIKLILAYHTVSQLGLIMLAINMGDEGALYGGIYHILSHALFKSVLFLCAGVIIEEYETRNVYQIRGVFQSMPAVSIACIAAILGITGAPLFNGSISKYMIAHGAQGLGMNILLMLINLGTLLSFIKFFSIFGKGTSRPRARVPRNRTIMLLLLGGLCLLGGLLGAQVIQWFYGHEIHIESSEYLVKSLIYGATLGIAYLLYRMGFTQHRLFTKLRIFDMGFNMIALSLPIFFTVLYLYLIL